MVLRDNIVQTCLEPSECKLERQMALCATGYLKCER